MKPPKRRATSNPRTPEGPSCLSRAFAEWLALPWTYHALALVLLAALGAARFWTPLTTPRALNDERIYELAFRAVQEGRSPYGVDGYYYPAAFSFLGGWLEARIGAPAVRNSLRALNYLALIGSLWLSTAWYYRARDAAARISVWLDRLAVATLLLLVSPGIDFGFVTGNLSFLAIGLALGGLAFVWRQPLLAGLAIGASVAFKPIAAAALPLLLLTPPRAGAHSYRLAGVSGGAICALLWLTFPYFPELLAQDISRLSYHRTWSLFRLSEVLRLEIPRLLLLAGLVAVAVAAGRAARSHREQWLAVALAASILATPLIWGHTLVLFFPVLVMAVSLAARRAHDRRPASWAEPIFVALACMTVLYFNAGAIDRMEPALEAFLLLVPVVNLVLLTGYVCRYCPTPLGHRTK